MSVILLSLNDKSRNLSYFIPFPISLKKEIFSTLLELVIFKIYLKSNLSDLNKVKFLSSIREEISLNLLGRKLIYKFYKLAKHASSFNL